MLFDVGARGGIDERWNGLQGFIDVVGFEPDPEECARLNADADRERFLPFALGASRSTARFHVAAWPVASSIHPADPGFTSGFAGGELLRTVETREIEMTTLDLVCEEQGTWPDLLKLDVEGAELDIIRGAPRAIDGVIALDVELAFAPLRREAPGFAEVDGYLRAQGFTLGGLRRVFWRHSSGAPVLVQGDGLYLDQRAFASPDRSTELKAELITEAYAPELRPDATAWEDSRFL